jgi:transposase-like protein
MENNIKYYSFLLVYLVLFLSLAIGIIRVIVSFKNEERCPRCNSEIDVERIRRSLPNRLIPFVESKNFICKKCHKSFHIRNFKKSSVKKLILGDKA